MDAIVISEEEKRLVDAGCVHISGLLYKDPTGAEAMGYIGPKPEDCGRWGDHDGLIVFVTEERRAWVCFGIGLNDVRSLVSDICPKGEGTSICRSEVEAITALELLMRFRDPNAEMSKLYE